MKKALVLALLALLAAAGLVYAQAELLTNGDFSGGTSDWDSVVGSFDIDNGCGAGVARVTNNGSGSHLVSQCVTLSSGGTFWTLSADIANLSSQQTLVRVQFYPLADCSTSSGTLEDKFVFTNNSTLTPLTNPFSFDNSGGAALSAAVLLTGSSDDSNEVVSCYDNVSLQETGTVAVTLSETAVSGPSVMPAVAGLLLLMAAISAAVLLRRRLA